jgi:hypothetical protein
LLQCEGSREGHPTNNRMVPKAKLTKVEEDKNGVAGTGAGKAKD